MWQLFLTLYGYAFFIAVQHFFKFNLAFLILSERVSYEYPRPQTALLIAGVGNRMVTAVVHHGLCAQFARKMLKGERYIKIGSEIIVDLYLGITRTIILRVRINAEVAVIIVQIAIERNFVKPQIKSETYTENSGRLDNHISVSALPEKHSNYKNYLD